MNALRLHAALCFSCVPLLAGPLAANGAEPDTRVVYKRTTNADGELVELALHVFKPVGHAAGDRRPAAVFFFGGGFVGGTPSQFYPQCRHLAERGMVAFAAEYRVKKRNGTTPRESFLDGKSAVRWVRANAAEWGVDPDRIAVGGGSAGGYIAAVMAIANGLEEPGAAPAVSYQPNALLLYNPMFDGGPTEDGVGYYGYDRVKAYWRSVSPVHNVRSGHPPTIAFLGEKDHLVPVESAERYREAVQAAGGRCDLHVYPGQKHGFFNHWKKSNAYADTTDKLTAFLASLGWVDADAATPGA